MNLPAVSEEWDLSAVGLRIQDPDLPYERFCDLCFMLGKFHEAVRFAIGDAIIQGEHLYGETVYQALELLNISEEGMREYVRVAQKVAPSVRRPDLSWSHHRAVAALEPDVQREWLERAAPATDGESPRLSHHMLREELRDGAPAKPMETCRCCGQRL